MDTRKLVKSRLQEIADNYSGFLKSYKERRNDFIASLDSFKNIDNKKIEEIISYFGYEGYNDIDEALDDLKNKIKFYKSMPDPVTLYRVIGVKNKKMIKSDNPGEHFTPYKWNIDSDMLSSIGYENWDEETKPYVMEVSVPHSEIDIPQTLIQNLSFPNEHEINLKNKGKGTKILKAYRLKGF